MDFLSALDVGATALSVERTQLNVISMNLANAKTTRTPEGGPYQRKSVVLQATDVDSPFSRVMKDALDHEIKGVKVAGMATDSRPPKRVFEPGHPDADKEGYVSYPDINVVEEMANMITVSRSYDANIATVTTVKGMYTKALELGR
jgi:flagellar basal-body rod protein FlgC